MQLTVNQTLQRSLKKKYWEKGITTLTVIQAPILDRVMDIDPRDLKLRVAGLINKKPMIDYLQGLWTRIGTIFAVQTERKLRGKSSGIQMEIKQDPRVDYWEDYFRHYINERSQKITGQIMDTQTQIVNNLIDGILEDATTEGASIYEIQKTMRDELSKNLTMINKYQAERIARTEVIGASNKGSFDSASQSGLCRTKSWRTSGLPGIRQSHLDFEAMGEVEMDYEYDSGLQYPGDPEGSPEEIVNCRCSQIFNVD